LTILEQYESKIKEINILCYEIFGWLKIGKYNIKKETHFLVKKKKRRRRKKKKQNIEEEEERNKKGF
jgi:IS30 family transposase